MSTRHGGKGGAIVNVSSIAAKLGGARRVRRLRRRQGRDRHLHHRPGQGSRRRGHPRQRRAPRHHPHRDPRRRAATRRASSASAQPRRWARRRARGSGARHPLAAVRRSVLPQRRAARRRGRPLSLAAVAYALLGPTASGKSGARAGAVPRRSRWRSSRSTRRRSTAAWTSAPPSRAPRSAPPCRTTCIDLIDPDQAYSAGQWRDAAIRAIAEIIGRGRTPLLVGGTMLYYRSLVGGPRRAAAGRSRAARRRSTPKRRSAAGRRCTPSCSRWIPRTARRVPPGDSQRIQRALEVFRLTGKPLSSLHGASRSASCPSKSAPSPCVPPDRAQLHAQDRRALRRRCCEAGLVEEVEALRRRFALKREHAQHARGRLPAGLGDARRGHRPRKPCASARSPRRASSPSGR